MLGIRPQTLCYLIAKARELQAKEEVVFPEDPNGSSEDWALQMLADHSGDMSLQEIKGTIDELDLDQQAELVALMWLGRGDYGLEEWDTAIEDARDQIEDRGNPTGYLLAHPMVSDDLEEGLIAHGYSCED